MPEETPTPTNQREARLYNLLIAQRRLTARVTSECRQLRKEIEWKDRSLEKLMQFMRDEWDGNKKA